MVALDNISMASFFSNGRTVRFSRRKETSKYFFNDLRLEGVWVEFTGLRGKKSVLRYRDVCMYSSRVL